MSADKTTAGRVHSLHSFGLGCVNLAIPADAKLGDLLDDFNCLFESARSAIEGMTEAAARLDGPQEIHEPWWAMLYTLRHAAAVHERLHDLAHAELVAKRRPGGGAD